MSHVNRLAQEKSPYLLQHARNPVDWYAWGEEAFETARRENKPIFLSIGYSTCHWCHVMAHESFEDEATAALMNREFVNIKVDREERPDIDRVYMTFVQATTGHGGWPMSVWLTPELQPFIGGTYFPPEDRYGHPGFQKVLNGIANAWKQSREKIVEQGARILEALREAQATAPNEGAKIDDRVLDQAFQEFARTFDNEEGGFGRAPKFPRAATFNFLVRYWARKRGTGDGERALEMDLFTLRKMAAGGIHDHIGGGFHRYSVDRYWHVPHFEKMLYDQAQLVIAYIDAFQVTRREQYGNVARDILDYVVRDMTSPDGGFYSAEDADSEDSVAAVSDRRKPEEEDGDGHRLSLEGREKKAEGAFYVWTEKGIDNLLGSDAELFKFHYGVQPHGNAPEGSDPHDEFRGKNILIERHSITDTAARFGRREDEVREIFARCREMLLSVRSKRPRPHLDDKILASWNGLMISAFARAAQAFGEGRYGDVAERATVFMRDQLYDAATKTLYRSYRGGRSNIEGFADDYAFVIQGLIDLYETRFDVEWLKLAIELQERQGELFWDDAAGGYFSTSGKDKSVMLRMKEDNDGAEPAASSVAASNLMRLAQMCGREEWHGRAEQTIQSFATTLTRFASAMPQMLIALDYSSHPHKQVVIAGSVDDPRTRALVGEVHRSFAPDKILLLADGGEGQEFLAARNAAIGAMTLVDNKPAAYVCENFTCRAAVTEPAQLRDLLME